MLYAGGGKYSTAIDRRRAAYTPALRMPATAAKRKYLVFRPLTYGFVSHCMI
jgi:hypothetical protein